MKLALIPPRQFLNDTYLAHEMQLMLPQWLEDDQYRNTYIDLKHKGSFVILDNGAAESSPHTMGVLTEMVKYYVPDEFAIPDTLGDASATLDQAYNFLEGFATDIPKETALGFVAQGRTVDEACRAVVELMKSVPGKRFIQTIYVPRLLLAESGDKRARLEVAQYVHYRFPRLNIHLFGASTEWVQEIRAAAPKRFIRSIDTSLPYNYGYAGVKIDEFTKRKVSRPEDYFNAKFDFDQEALVRKNVSTMKRWAYGA